MVVPNESHWHGVNIPESPILTNMALITIDGTIHIYNDNRFKYRDDMLQQCYNQHKTGANQPSVSGAPAHQLSSPYVATKNAMCRSNSSVIWCHGRTVADPIVSFPYPLANIQKTRKSTILTQLNIYSLRTGKIHHAIFCWENSGTFPRLGHFHSTLPHAKLPDIRHHLRLPANFFIHRPLWTWHSEKWIMTWFSRYLKVSESIWRYLIHSYFKFIAIWVRIMSHNVIATSHYRYLKVL